MGLTTSLFTGLTGLNASSEMLTVTGNNISNVNTTAFKRSRISFETQILQTLSNGSAPSGELGGTNPSQVGLGTRLATIRRDFSSGALQPTGVATDMAVEGNGFFIVDVAGSRRFTRAGNFTLDRDFNLVNADGGRVQGFGVDSQFNVVDGVLQDINIPIGVRTLAERTQNVSFAGNLNAGGDVATTGTVLQTETLYADAAETTTADASTALTSVFVDDGTGTSTAVNAFATGDVITVTGARRGGAVIPDKTFEVNATNTTGSDANGTTVGDLMTFLDNIFGIDTTVTTLSTPGVTIAGGVLSIEGNLGTGNALELDPANFVVSSGGATSTPIDFSETTEATGESERTTFVAFDSLGNELVIDLTLVLESLPAGGGTQWRYYAFSENDAALDTALSTGLLNFSDQGQLVSVSDDDIALDLTGTGATTPQSITLNFEGAANQGSVTALTDPNSQISAINQDGAPLGSLESFNVSQDGTITGVFSNGLLRTLGRIPLAMFSNNEGLEEIGANLFRETVNSGTATFVTPGSGGSGRVIGRSLELSNVDLAEEFVNLISSTTGFSASSRVITTSDRLIQELLSLTR